MYTDILQINNTSIFIANIKEHSRIVIGVPHHIPVGVFDMPCNSHKHGDRNTGYIGNYIAENLNCSFLCACNYFIDANKNYNLNYSDYYMALQRCKPKYLVEIHGHGLEHAGNDIEISSGCKEEEHHALELKYEMEKIIEEELFEDKDNKELEQLKKLRIDADFDKIYFKASKSSTIIDKRWISYHIELPLILRIDNERKCLPKEGVKFSSILCEAINNLCI